MQPIYKRILLKLSGEALQGDLLSGLEPSKLLRIAQEIGSVVELGVQIALVIGGGNLIRGVESQASGFDRITADQMGMLATVINGLALRDALEANALPALLMSAFSISGIVNQYERGVAREVLQQGKVVIFSAGTGNPLVTTDSAAALRGIEIGADIIIKATKVEGIFNKDPIQHPTAHCYQQLTYTEVINQRLEIMDLSAIFMCQAHRLPLRIFNMNKPGALRRILMGEPIGTLIQEEK